MSYSIFDLVCIFCAQKNFSLAFVFAGSHDVSQIQLPPNDEEDQPKEGNYLIAYGHVHMCRSCILEGSADHDTALNCPYCGTQECRKGKVLAIEGYEDQGMCDECVTTRATSILKTTESFAAQSQQARPIGELQQFNKD